jgi:hypothetical protein
MMWVSKVPNYDAYGLFRALHSHNPPWHHHIILNKKAFGYFCKIRSDRIFW